MTQTITAFAQNNPVSLQLDTNTPVVNLEGLTSSKMLIGHIDYFLDPTHALLPQDMLGREADRFQRLRRSTPDFGYTKSAVWLRLQVTNQTQTESNWLFHFRENFKQIFDVFVAHADGTVENTLSQSLERGFDTRPVNYPELVAPMNLDPGERAIVFVRYWSEGSSSLEFSIQTTASFAAIASARSAKNYIYYGMTLLLIIGSLIAFAISRRGVFLAYFGNCLSIMLFLMHADGVTFQYLWPSFPRFNGFASILIGSAIIVLAANFARVFLDTRKYHPVMDKMLWAVIILGLLLPVSAMVIDNQQLKQSMVLIALVSISLCALSGIIAARTRFKEVRFFLLAWFVFLASSAIMNLRHQLGIEISQDTQHDFMRFAMVADAVFMGLAIGDRYNQLRQSRQEALRRNLQEANRNLYLSQRLGELEKQYGLAFELAENRDREFANAIHDLRQPLHALRVNVRNLVSGKQPENSKDAKAGDFDETFTYLERLVAGFLDKPPGTSRGPDPNAEPLVADHESESLSVQEVLESVHEMFKVDAQAKGLEFRFLNTSHEGEVDPLVLMRIVSNLVANAIKYTESGGLLLGTRRRGDMLRIEVHDTGPGMDAVSFKLACKRNERLNADKTVEGKGLGLAIVARLARENGYRVFLDPTRKTGCGIVVEIPIGPEMAADMPKRETRLALVSRAEAAQ